MAAPTHISSTTKDFQSAAALTFTLGTHIAGDLMIAFVKQSNNVNAELWDDDGGGGNGWTLDQQHRTTGGRDMETAIFWKFATSSSETNPTFTWDTGGETDPMSGIIEIYRGVSQLDPFSGSGFQYTNAQNNAAPPNPSTTIDFADTRVVCFHGATHDDISSPAAPTGFTLRSQVWNGTNDDHRNVFSADIEIDATGTYTPPNWQHSVLNIIPEYQTYTVGLNASSAINISGGTFDDTFVWGANGLTILGNGFKSTQGTGRVEIWSDSSGTVKVSQTINTWNSDTSITFDSVQGSLTTNGAVYLVVTNSDGDESNPIEINVGILTYEDWINSELKPDHRWLFDGSSDDSGITGPTRNFNQDVEGTPTYPSLPIAGNNSKSLFIDNIFEALEISQSPNMNITIKADERTLMFWVSLGSIQKSLSCFYKEGGRVQNLAFLLGLGNVLVWQLADTATNRDNVQAYSDFRLDVDRVYCVVGRYSHLDTVKESRLFIDGVKQSVTDGNPMTLGIFDTHSGSVLIGDPDNSLEMGTVDINFAGQETCRLSHFCTWSDNSTGTNAGGISEADIELLFERGAVPEIVIAEDTQANMQADIDTYADTVRGNTPLAIRIERLSGGGDFELVLDNINFDPKCSLNIQYMGSTGETLTLVNSNGGSIDASKISTFTGGSVQIKENVTVKVTVKDFDNGSVIENARVRITADAGGSLTEGDVILEGLTNSFGILTTNIRYSIDQPIAGRIRKATSGTLYKTSPVSGSVLANGLDIEIFLIKDQ